jgi:hypothetical protein
MKEFISKNADKLLVLLVLTGFYVGSFLAFRWGYKEFGVGSFDLVKQFAAALLTLAVGSRMATRSSDQNGNGNGSGATTTSTSTEVTK